MSNQTINLNACQFELTNAQMRYVLSQYSLMSRLMLFKSSILLMLS